jgi:hypothetical protein
LSSQKVDQVTDDLKTQGASSATMRKMLEDVGVSFRSVSTKFDALSSKVNTALLDEPEAIGHANDIAVPVVNTIGVPGRALCSILHTENHYKKKKADLERSILKAFEYEQMEYRQEIIPEAHAQTFRWIIDGSVDDSDIIWDDYMQWLRGPDCVYWMKGKAASGKSTLMKFLLGESGVEAQLRQWSGDLPLIRANFFFWSLGTRLQKSQMGLLMSLLREILNQRRDIIPEVLPTLWQQLSSMDALTCQSLQMGWCRWSFATLSSAFEAVVRRVTKDAKLVLFIDGLDEFDGDHSNIAETFCHYAKLHNSNIKICVSSRPLMPFEYSFKGCKHLQLQDLTAADIRKYITEKLSGHEHFTTLALLSPDRADGLIEEVAVKSSGVFLWVHLVVKSLLAGLTNYDSMEDLTKRLEALPEELDNLYGAMLRSIHPPFYRKQASQLLQVVYQHQVPMSTLALSFADDEDSDLALRMPPGALTLQQVDARIETISHRVKSRCQGLLEVQTYNSSSNIAAKPDTPFRQDQVQYLHITVRDYLEKPDIWGDLLSWTADSDFDASLACLRSLILRIKTSFCYHGWGFYVWRLLDNAVDFARRAESSTGCAHTSLLNEVDDLASALLPVERSLPWFADEDGDHAQFCQESCTCLRITFPIYAIAKGLTLYVRRKFGHEIKQLNSQSSVLLLDVATGVSFSLRDDRIRFPPGTLFRRGQTSWMGRRGARCNDPRPLPSMIKMLLDLGLDPNESRDGSTAWLNLLKHLEQMRSKTPRLRPVWIDICKLFILYGAELNNSRGYNELQGERPSIGKSVENLFSDVTTASAVDLFRLIDQQSRKTPRKRKRQQSPSKRLTLEQRTTCVEQTPSGQQRRQANRGRKKSRR